MYEHCRGTDSFWEPFLAMLPMPGSVSEWTDDEMGELQDEVLATESAWRPRFQKQHYDRLMDPLCERFPDIFGETRKEEEGHAPILIDVCWCSWCSWCSWCGVDDDVCSRGFSFVVRCAVCVFWGVVVDTIIYHVSLT